MSDAKVCNTCGKAISESSATHMDLKFMFTRTDMDLCPTCRKDFYQFMGQSDGKTNSHTSKSAISSSCLNTYTNFNNVCPKCGSELFYYCITTNPPVNVEECHKCGYRLEHGSSRSNSIVYGHNRKDITVLPDSPQDEYVSDLNKICNSQVHGDADIRPIVHILFKNGYHLQLPGKSEDMPMPRIHDVPQPYHVYSMLEDEESMVYINSSEICGLWVEGADAGTQSSEEE